MDLQHCNFINQNPKRQSYPPSCLNNLVEDAIKKMEAASLEYIQEVEQLTQSCSITNMKLLVDVENWATEARNRQSHKIQNDAEIGEQIDLITEDINNMKYFLHQGSNSPKEAYVVSWDIVVKKHMEELKIFLKKHKNSAIGSAAAYLDAKEGLNQLIAESERKFGPTLRKIQKSGTSILKGTGAPQKSFKGQVERLLNLINQSQDDISRQLKTYLEQQGFGKIKVSSKGFATISNPDKSKLLSFFKSNGFDKLKNRIMQFGISKKEAVSKIAKVGKRGGFITIIFIGHGVLKKYQQDNDFDEEEVKEILNGLLGIGIAYIAGGILTAGAVMLAGVATAAALPVGAVIAIVVLSIVATSLIVESKWYKSFVDGLYNSLHYVYAEIFQPDAQLKRIDTTNRALIFNRNISPK